MNAGLPARHNSGPTLGLIGLGLLGLGAMRRRRRPGPGALYAGRAVERNRTFP